MLPRNHPDRIQITFDDRRLVANAGLLLPATLARHLGLPELVRQRLDLGDAPGRANTIDKMMTLVASALAGGDCIDDADVLRTGGTAVCAAAGGDCMAGRGGTTPMCCAPGGRHRRLHPGRHGQGAIHPGHLPAQLPVGPRPSTRPGEPRVAGPGLAGRGGTRRRAPGRPDDH